MRTHGKLNRNHVPGSECWLGGLVGFVFHSRARQNTPGDGNQLWFYIDTKSILFESALEKLSSIGFTHKGSVCWRCKRQHSRTIGGH